MQSITYSEVVPVLCQGDLPVDPETAAAADHIMARRVHCLRLLGYEVTDVPAEIERRAAQFEAKRRSTPR